MKHINLILLILLVVSCKKEAQTTDSITETIITKTDTVYIETYKGEPIKTAKALKAELTEKGYQTFDYFDEKTQDTILMQQYFIAFLKSGPIRSQNEEEAAKLQEAHLAHLGRMYEEGYADISGPFGDNGDIRGITIYNVPTLKMADSLANADPMVKAGRLVIEIHPWWAAKGFPLR
ncbi:YciI family protein [Hanstruepera ponticola]|uniref:YciI family protein n=1 Tax=Hanstruepera ponticola TaxID=2042995 RepID=UPI000CF15C3B|nr:YciI family protein [Hanstruepera ponticola]